MQVTQAPEQCDGNPREGQGHDRPDHGAVGRHADPGDQLDADDRAQDGHDRAEQEGQGFPEPGVRAGGVAGVRRDRTLHQSS